jgi:uncharacterized UBP type Zn finger protein
MSIVQNVVIDTPCAHAALARIASVERPAAGCEECLRIGSPWVHLRVCLTCGTIACCDSSPSRHARRHFRASGHPLVTSAEVGETWVWCYADERALAA